MGSAEESHRPVVSFVTEHRSRGEMMVLNGLQFTAPSGTPPQSSPIVGDNRQAEELQPETR
jgi:hypothetical protein